MFIHSTRSILSFGFARRRFVFSLIAAACLLSTAARAQDNTPSLSPEAADRITANAVGLNPDDSNYYESFAPELPKTLARVPGLDSQTGLFVVEVKPNLFYVTEGIYQSAFLKTGDGVIVFDAPPSFAHKLPSVIREHAPNEEIKYLIYSHGHGDHIGGASEFRHIDGLNVIAASGLVETITEQVNRGFLAPTITFEESYDLSLGDEVVELKTASFHSEDVDVIVYLPRQKFVIAVDTITPGEAPFMNFGATADVGRYLRFFDEILKYDFDMILSGHVSILGNRHDVLEAREYAFDVNSAVLRGMETFLERFNTTLETFEYRNPNLAYRVAIESVRRECSVEVIDSWKDRLSVVDVWADSHCQALILYYIMH